MGQYMNIFAMSWTVINQYAWLIHWMYGQRDLNSGCFCLVVLSGIIASYCFLLHQWSWRGRHETQHILTGLSVANSYLGRQVDQLLWVKAWAGWVCLWLVVGDAFGYWCMWLLGLLLVVILWWEGFSMRYWHRGCGLVVVLFFFISTVNLYKANTSEYMGAYIYWKGEKNKG